MTGAGLGWLQGTIQGVTPEWLQTLIARATGETAEPRAGGTRWYGESATVGPHVLLGWAPRSHPERGEVYFEVHQTALDALGGADSLDLARELAEAGAKFTRVDIYLDDRERRATPLLVAEAFRQGQVVTHIRRIRTIAEYVQADGGTVLDGSTTYLGSPKSLAMVRVYDKAAESGREDAGIRWEFQARADHAERLIPGALMARDELGSFAIGCVCQLVDFRDRADGQRGDRRPRLGWWAELLGDGERVSLTGPARVDTIERVAGWLLHQVAPSLALATQAYGPSWLRALLADGDRRLTEEDRQRLLRLPERSRVLP